MKISVTTTVVKDINIEYPSFYKKYSSCYALLSDDTAITVITVPGHYGITKSETEHVLKFTDIQNCERITEEEFNAAYENALSKIQESVQPMILHERQNILVTPLAY